jgi:diaminopimelate decarboxylase
MNDFIRPVLYNANHRIEPVRRTSERKVPYDIVGPLCESGDFLARGIRLPKVSKDDYLALFTAGAYGSSMGSNYNSRFRPPEIAVAGRNAIVIRERESFKDLVRNQKIKGVTGGLINNLKKAIDL